MRETGHIATVRLDDGSLARIDPIDRERLSDFTWRAVEIDGRFQIVALESLIPTTQPPLFLARFVTGAQPRDRIICLNGDVRDCRRGNLAIISARELVQLERTLQRTAI